MRKLTRIEFHWNP